MFLDPLFFLVKNSLMAGEIHHLNGKYPVLFSFFSEYLRENTSDQVLRELCRPERTTESLLRLRLRLLMTTCQIWGTIEIHRHPILKVLSGSSYFCLRIAFFHPHPTSGRNNADKAKALAYIFIISTT